MRAGPEARPPPWEPVKSKRGRGRREGERLGQSARKEEVAGDATALGLGGGGGD